MKMHSTYLSKEKIVLIFIVLFGPKKDECIIIAYVNIKRHILNPVVYNNFWSLSVFQY